MADLDDITRQLLDYLGRGGQCQYYWLASETEDSKRSLWWTAGQPAPIPTTAAHVYFGVHPGKANKGEYRRNQIEDVAAINCLFAEFDAKDYVVVDEAEIAACLARAQAEKPGATEEQLRIKARDLAIYDKLVANLEYYRRLAWQQVEALSIVPSVIIDSGGGYHCYWLLYETFLLITPEDIQRAKNIQALWVVFVGSDDAAKDLARVLRLPGTLNVKRRYRPNYPLCRILKADFNVVYSLAVLEARCQAHAKQSGSTNGHSNGHNQQNSEPTGSLERYGRAALAGELSILARTVEGHRNEQLNRSAFVLGTLVGAGVLTEDEVRDALIQTGEQAGLTKREVARTVQSGLGDGMANKRDLSELYRKEEARRSTSASRNGHGNAQSRPTSANAEAPTEPQAPRSETPSPSLASILAELRALDKSDLSAIKTAATGQADLIAELPPVDRLQLMTALEHEFKLPLRFLTELKTTINKLHREQESINETTAVSSSGVPYDVQDGRLVTFRLDRLTGEMVAVVIADFEARIVEESVDEGGEKTYIIEGNAVRRGPFRAEAPATTFSDDKALEAIIEAAAGANDPVRAGQGRHLGPAIKLLSDTNLRQSRRYTRTGWAGDTFLIPGHTPEGVTLHLPRKLPYSVTATAELSKGLEALDALIQSLTPVRMTPIIAYVLQAAAARRAGWENERYGMMILGETGSFKTTVAQTTLAIYGPDFIRDDLLIKLGEGTTRNAIMALATSASDAPMLIDNFKPSTGGGGRDLVNLIHNIVEGGEKDRLNRSSELRDTKPVNCWPLFTGEDLPDSDPATTARLMVIRFPKRKAEPNQQLAKAQALAASLGSIGLAWITWLESEQSKTIIAEIAGRFMERRAAWAADLALSRPDMANPLRVATNLATNELTWQIAGRHPELGPIVRRYADDHRLGLQQIADDMANATTESLEALRYLKALQSLLASGRMILLPKNAPANTVYDPDRLLGWTEPNGIAYVIPEIARQAVDRILPPPGLAGISPQALYAQLDRLGFIVSKGKDQVTKLVKIWDKGRRVLCLAPTAFAEGEPED